MIDYLGYAATAVVVASYFSARPDTLRRVQMVAAVMWLVYGLVLPAAPVVVANVLVLCAAAWTTSRSSQRLAS